MIRPLSPRSNRRGNTLVVTLALLTLLAVVGIAAVYFARDQAERARIQGQPPVDPNFSDNGMGALNAFLSQLTYDSPDSGQGLLSSLRGHSFMATMYNRQWQQTGIAPYGAVVPWNGVGSFNEQVNITINGVSFPPVNRPYVVNHAIYGNGQKQWFDPEYAGDRSAGSPTIPGSYIPKNAAYTYPDMKDFYLAVQCQATGEILVPSFYRPSFRDPSQAATDTGLEPWNPRWTNGLGLHLCVRPTQIVHPTFPSVPPNADGTYTGDVQNLPGAFGFNGCQRNDSIWIDIGMPAFTLPNGKRVKALVAPLILDLDGRLNLNIHGNQLNGGAHTSGVGMDPWEISLEKGLFANVADARALVTSRGPPSARSGLSTKAYAPRLAVGNQLPQYGAVPWTGNGGSLGGSAPGAMGMPVIGSLNLPGYGGSLLYNSQPIYNPIATPGYDSTNNPIANHPALYNPTEWGRYPVSDTKYLSFKYAAPPSFYTPMIAGGVAQNTLRGNSNPFAVPAPPTNAATFPNGYRLDPSHVNRQLFTTYAYGLDRTGLTPGIGAGGVGQTQALNAALGGIDLNRPLADYRVNTSLPLDPTNVTAASAAAAAADRQLFAMDIFARLIAANAIPTTVASVTAAGTVTFANAPPTAADVATLRPLAQLAANIVDYIDADDISTQFVWNPTGLTMGDQMVFGVEKPRVVVNEAYGEIVNDPSDAAFSDVNKKTTAKNAAHVRFWLELQNPTNSAYAGVGTGPLGTGALAGSAKLVYAAAETGGSGAYSPYQVLIVRNSKVAGSPVSDLLRNPNNPNNPGNVTGALPAGVAPDITFQFTPAAGLATSTLAPANGVANGGIVVCAANVTTDPVAPPTSTAIVPMGPIDFNPGFATAINGTATPAAIGGSVSSLAYPFPLPMTPDSNVPDTINGLGWHVVLLQRLANPYLPGPTAANPYITVDILDDVRAADRILLANGSNNGSQRSPRASATGAGFEPITAAGGNDFRPRSSGKVQPYTTYSPITGMGLGYAGLPGAPAFPNSLVLYQNPTVPDASGVRHTFTRQNSIGAAAPGQTYAPGTGALASGDTLMTPYDWFVHMDRPLINQLELLHVTVGKPHEWTLNSVIPNVPGGAATDVTKFAGSAYSQLLNNPNYAQIYRALDLLRVQPYGQMTALGGRLAGRININTIQDKRVWDALFDARSGVNGFTQAQVDQLWTGLIAGGPQSRTLAAQQKVNAAGNNLTGSDGVTQYATPIPGNSVYDAGVANADRPFLPFGASTVGAGGYQVGPTAIVYPGGTGLNDTLLRINPLANPPLPWLTVPATHPYQQAEAIRKIMNNTTTVSHSFAVFVTVGYFEVVAETNSNNFTQANGTPAVFTQLGREIYRDVPGDSRNKFFAIVDRSNIGLDPVSYQTFQTTRLTPPVHAGSPASSAPGVPPIFTTVESNVAAGVGPTQFQIYAPNGNVYSIYTPSGQSSAIASPVPITGNITLVIGTGANQEIVSASVLAGGANGLSTVTATLTKNHYAGESVSNIVPGNPGPQANFDVTQAPYTYVVPHWSKIP